jgi:hypothetical protein
MVLILFNFCIHIDQVILSVEAVNSYIAWDFSLQQGDLNMVLVLYWFLALKQKILLSIIVF